MFIYIYIYMVCSTPPVMIFWDLWSFQMSSPDTRDEVGTTILTSYHTDMCICMYMYIYIYVHIRGGNMK